MNANAQSQYSIEYQLIEFLVKLNKDIWLKLRLSGLVTHTDDPPTCHTGGHAKPTPVGTQYLPLTLI